VKFVVNGIVAALLAIWAVPYIFGGFDLPVAYGWVLALLFVAVDMSYVSLRLARVDTGRTGARGGRPV
jgi:hypothetical protein